MTRKEKAGNVALLILIVGVIVCFGLFVRAALIAAAMAEHYE